MANANPRNCPWCGFELMPDATACPRCRWSRERPDTRPAMLAYGFFLLVMLVLGGLTLLWALQFRDGGTEQEKQKGKAVRQYGAARRFAHAPPVRVPRMRRI